MFLKIVKRIGYLRCGVVLVLFFGEFVMHHIKILSTGWPVVGGDGQDHHVLVIADPQLVDQNSYTEFVELRARIADKAMERSYDRLVRFRRPDTVLFLGDLLDGGRHWDDEAFNLEMVRFRRIFQSDRPSGATAESKPELLYVAGNHDIGIGNSTYVDKAERFEKTYNSTLNYVRQIGGVNLVVLNTLGLVEESENPLSSETRQFMETVRDGQLSRSDPATNKDEGKENNDNEEREYVPNILFTHVPLFRPDNTDCGPLRKCSRKWINQFRGYQYQNLIEEKTTRDILEAINPKLVFSGDDHDVCEYLLPNNATDVTVATFSSFQGTLYPGYVFLTINQGKFAYVHGQVPYAQFYVRLYLGLAGAVIGLRLVMFIITYKNRLYQLLPSPVQSVQRGVGLPLRTFVGETVEFALFSLGMYLLFFLLL